MEQDQPIEAQERSLEIHSFFAHRYFCEELLEERGQGGKEVKGIANEGEDMDEMR